MGISTLNALKNLQQRVVRLRIDTADGLKRVLIERRLGTMQQEVERLVREAETSEPQRDYEILIRGTWMHGLMMELPVWLGDMAVAADSEDTKATPDEKAAKRTVSARVITVYQALYGDQMRKLTAADIYISLPT